MTLEPNLTLIKALKSEHLGPFAVVLQNLDLAVVNPFRAPNHNFFLIGNVTTDLYGTCLCENYVIVIKPFKNDVKLETTI